jgi:hypothetical protein
MRSLLEYDFFNDIDSWKAIHKFCTFTGYIEPVLLMATVEGVHGSNHV